jgi:hypothetical protein
MEAMSSRDGDESEMIVPEKYWVTFGTGRFVVWAANYDEAIDTAAREHYDREAFFGTHPLDNQLVLTLAAPVHEKDKEERDLDEERERLLRRRIWPSTDESTTIRLFDYYGIGSEATFTLWDGSKIVLNGKK